MMGIEKRQRTRPSDRLGHEGFTLLEVVVALSILAVTFVVLLGLRNRDILQHQEARYITRATLLAQKKMSEVEMAGFPPLGVVAGDFPEPDDIFNWTQTVTTTPFDFAREVNVTVTWREGEGQQSVILDTFVVDEKS
ncbi:MAG TPA: prepilin-type N-terminal cleavage/methylation domain-containing protein [Nitrospiria bacterium]|jgi:general secretion pathway protein I|nr:prepilin-type N-terminal cleavage/methylation domain-containing protein [Nitrospiria bacterium]